jgi:hypothetical protein
MHREALCSAGLHLFQELSTLGQQLTHPLLLGQGLGRIIQSCRWPKGTNLRPSRIQTEARILRSVVVLSA